MTPRSSASACLLVALIAAAGPQADAASFAAGGASAYCDLTMTGDVEPGDLDRLKAALNGRSKASLCLNSPGGAYVEAIDIIAYLTRSEIRVRTIVDRGAECYSACALIFMAGGVSTLSRPDRKLHVEGVLGFHAPYLTAAGDVKAAPAVVAKAHRAGLRSIRRLLELNPGRVGWTSNLQGKPFLPDDLVAKFLMKAPDEFLQVETVDNAGRWQIDLIGHEAVRTPSPEQLVRACSNDMHWAIDMANEPGRLSKQPITLKSGQARMSFPGFGDEAVWNCVVDVYQSPSRGTFLSLMFSDGSEGDEDGFPAPKRDALKKAVDASDDPLAPIGTPLWYIYPPETPIRSLAAKQGNAP